MTEKLNTSCVQFGHLYRPMMMTGWYCCERKGCGACAVCPDCVICIPKRAALKTCERHRTSGVVVVRADGSVMK